MPTYQLTKRADKMTFGQWLREQREQRRWSITDCAKQVNMTASQWSRLEADEPKRRDGRLPQPTRETVERVAVALGIPLEQAMRAADYVMRVEIQDQKTGRSHEYDRVRGLRSVSVDKMLDEIETLRAQADRMEQLVREIRQMEEGDRKDL